MGKMLIVNLSLCCQNVFAQNVNARQADARARINVCIRHRLQRLQLARRTREFSHQRPDVHGHGRFMLPQSTHFYGTVTLEMPP